jgi:Tfp pilus assembly protein PilN
LIEINLLPGSTKRAPKRGLPRLGGGGGPSLGLGRLRGVKLDRTMAIVVGLWVVGVGGLAAMHFPSSARQAQLEEDIRLAVEDSARTATQLAQTQSLMAQEQVIAQKLEVIAEIDGARYIWPHILDEVSRALPAYVWLTGLTNIDTDAGGLPRVRIEGRAGNYFALTRFMEDLELSPFIQQVRWVSATQTQEAERVVYTFVFEAAYETPPPDVIETAPVFPTAGEPAGGEN